MFHFISDIVFLRQNAQPRNTIFGHRSLLLPSRGLAFADLHTRASEKRVGADVIHGRIVLILVISFKNDLCNITRNVQTRVFRTRDFRVRTRRPRRKCRHACNFTPCVHIIRVCGVCSLRTYVYKCTLCTPARQLLQKTRRFSQRGNSG